MDPSAKARIRLLAVDDDPHAGKLAAAVLGEAGFSVDLAESLASARTALARSSYALLLVDLRLPDGDGLALLPEARARDPHAAAVVLTGSDSRQSAVAALRAGAYDFLTKPCPPALLEAAVSRAAERYWLSSSLAERTRQLETANGELDGRVRDATAEIFSLNEKLSRNLAELRENNEAQTRFLEDMTHELKNPLCVVWGYVNYLLRQGIPNCSAEEITRALESIRRNSEHLTAMVEEMTEVARLDSSKVALNRSRFPAREAVLEAGEGLRLQAQEKGLTLSVDEPAADLEVFADRNRLRQILVNLVTNAVKFTPAGGRITLSARPEGTKVHFSVEDTGKGIDPKDCARIFDRFYQVSDPEHRHRGLGLGLHIVAGLVQLHEGRIWVESAPGKGSCFHFTLPAQASVVKGAPKGSAGKPPAKGTPLSPRPGPAA